MSSSSIKFVPTGASLQELVIASHNIVLGFNSASEYAKSNPCYFGATIGRIANRVKGARINSLNGAPWALVQNNGENSLHGGSQGWDKRQWRGPKPLSKDGKESVEFTYLSKHLEEGYPGDLEVRAVYTAEEKEGKVVLGIEYKAQLVGDEADETAVNITNHSYFNLSGKPTIEGTVVSLETTEHLPLDAGGIPISVSTASYPGITANTPFTLGPSEPDIDDCFVYPADDPSAVPLDTRSRPLRTHAKFYHPETKIHLEVASTEPAFQFYTGKYVDVEAREDGTPKRVARGGFCVEPSRYVDAVNRDEWKSQVVVKKGQVYGTRIVYTAWSGEPEGV